MKPAALLQLGAELMFQFRHSDSAADRAIGQYLSDRRFLGQQDRHFLSESFFHTLRHLRRIDESMEGAFSQSIVAETKFTAGFPVYSESGAAAWARTVTGRKPNKRPKQKPTDRLVDTIRLGLAAMELDLITPNEIAGEAMRCWPNIPNKFKPTAESAERMIGRAAEVMELYKTPKRNVDAERACSFPTWLWTLMGAGRDPVDLLALGQALGAQSPVALRVNTLKTTLSEAEEALGAKGWKFRPGELAPDSFLLNDRVPRGDIPNFREGWFEVQDEGSQMISIYAAPEPGQTVVDACAGGGGKTLHLAALMENRGCLYAYDEDRKRLEPLVRRADRAGVGIIQIAEPKVPAPENVDLVLVDAPCSGTGTLRRNPENRWRLTQDELNLLVDVQAGLLDRWAPRVKVGGCLVYATCSVLQYENQDQIRRFLERHPEYTLAPPKMIRHDLLSREGFMTLEPNRHGCDGFFAARLCRIS